MDESDTGTEPVGLLARASALLYFISEGEWGDKFSDEYQTHLKEVCVGWLMANFPFGLVVAGWFERFVDYMTKLLSRH